jgi:ATP-dependent DNA ligase
VARLAHWDSMAANKITAAFVEPMLLLRTEHLPEGPEWVHEIKLDGYRALAIKSGGKVQLRSRNGNDFTARYESIAAALRAMPDETVLDGEVVALDENGHPVRSQNAKRRRVQRPSYVFKQLPSSYNDDAVLRAEAVRLRWPLAMTVGPLVAHSVHPY